MLMTLLKDKPEYHAEAEIMVPSSKQMQEHSLGGRIDCSSALSMLSDAEEEHESRSARQIARGIRGNGEEGRMPRDARERASGCLCHQPSIIRTT